MAKNGQKEDLLLSSFLLSCPPTSDASVHGRLAVTVCFTSHRCDGADNRSSVSSKSQSDNDEPVFLEKQVNPVALLEAYYFLEGRILYLILAKSQRRDGQHS